MLSTHPRHPGASPLSANIGQAIGHKRTKQSEPLSKTHSMHSFSVSFRSSGPVEILTLIGELDAHTATELDAAISRCLQNGRTRIVVDGTGLEYISSAGLGVFLGHIDEIREQGGDLIICGLRARVLDVFDLLGLPMLFRILDAEEQAIGMLAEQPEVAG